MTARIINADDYRRMRWKNGGGETIEIARYPGNSDLNAFGWRISMATVASDGPFSGFPDVERTLCVLSGAGISLAVGNNIPVQLDAESAPFSFPADVAATAQLTDGPITDFNVMTRRGDWRHKVRRLRAPAGDVIAIASAATHTIVFCRNGSLEASDGTARLSLTTGATLSITRGGEHWSLRSVKPAVGFIVEIEPAHA